MFMPSSLIAFDYVLRLSVLLSLYHIFLLEAWLPAPSSWSIGTALDSVEVQ